MLMMAVGALGADPTPSAVRIAAPVSTKTLVEALIREIKRDKGVTVTANYDNTSAEALDEMGQEQADIAIMTHLVTGEDRAHYPELDLHVAPVGMETVALAVSSDVWNANFRTITKQNVKDIYEGKVKNWKEIGGPDVKVTMFNVPEGQGIWETFAEWLYGDNRKAPLPKGVKAPTSEDSRDDLEFSEGGFAPMAAAFVDDSRCHALLLEDTEGHVSKPKAAFTANGDYPICRPIIAVTVGPPSLDIRTVTEYMTSPAGQALVGKFGALGEEAVPTPTPVPDF